MPELDAPGSMMPESRGRFMPLRGQYQGIMPCLPGIRDVLGIRDSRVGLPRLKLILSRGGVPGHILACDMLICPTDTRSKNMPTRQPPYIQPILDHHLLIVPPGWKGSKVNWKLRKFKIWIRLLCTKCHQDEKWSFANWLWGKCKSKYLTQRRKKYNWYKIQKYNQYKTQKKIIQLKRNTKAEIKLLWNAETKYNQY